MQSSIVNRVSGLSGNKYNHIPVILGAILYPILNNPMGKTARPQCSSICHCPQSLLYYFNRNCESSVKDRSERMFSSSLIIQNSGRFPVHNVWWYYFHFLVGIKTVVASSFLSVFETFHVLQASVALLYPIVWPTSLHLLSHNSGLALVLPFLLLNSI